MAAITKYYMQDVLKSRPSRPFAHTSGGWKSKIKVQAGLVSQEACLLGLQMTIFSFYPHMPFLCANTEKEREWSLVSFIRAPD